MRPKKFKKGRAIRSVAALDKWLEREGWCYFGRSPRPKHPSVIVSMTFSTLTLATQKGGLWRAERIT